MNTRLITIIVLGSTAMSIPAAAGDALDNNFSPMTRSERLRRYLKGSFGSKALEKSALSAEMGQVTNNPKEWGRTAGGYGARVGSAIAQHAIRGTLEYGASAALHEDNRYFGSRRHGFWRRTRYAIVSSFLARHDNGKRGFGFSRIGSAAGAAFISRAWMPGAAATVGAGAGSFGITIAADIGVNMLREFWPDIKKHFRRE